MRLLTTLLLAGLALAPAGLAADKPAKVPTLRTESRLPAAELKGYYDADTWKVIGDMPIAGFVLMRGAVDREKGGVTVTKHVHAYPNAAKNEFATELSKLVKLPYDSLASRVPATADICVIFYEPTPQDRQALVYAKAGENRFYDIVQYRAKAP